MEMRRNIQQIIEIIKENTTSITPKERFGSFINPVIIIVEEFYKLKYCSTVVYMVPRA